MMRSLVVAMLVAAVPALGAAAPGADASAEQRAEVEAQYARGTQALDRGEWDAAAQAFERVAALKDGRADAALYWRAYALNKGGRRGAALETIAALQRGYPQSRWTRDASALALEIRQASGEAPAVDESGSDELKLLALNGLMRADPDRALPLIKQMLAADSSPKLRERALFVLAQSGTPAARETLAATAKNAGNPDLQAEAIKYLGIFGGAEGKQLLADVYTSAKDVRARRAVLQALMVSGDRARLAELARTETDADLRRQAIQLLGVSGGRDDLWQMYKQEKDPETKRAIINGLFVSGGRDQIGQLATTESDPEVRRDAIQKLGLMGAETAPTLKTLYANDKDPAARRAVLNAFFVQGNAAALIEIARREQDPELKKDAVSKLSLMHSKEATEYMLELLK